MTATQVFFRFAKEHGYYRLLSRSIDEVNLHMKKYAKPNKHDSLAKMHGNKNFVVDLILKYNHYCLLDVIWLLQVYSMYFRKNHPIRTIHKEWFKYLRENINGNYLKKMITDDSPELNNLGYRNGYHALNFSLKDKNRQ